MDVTELRDELEAIQARLDELSEAANKEWHRMPLRASTRNKYEALGLASANLFKAADMVGNIVHALNPVAN